MASISIEKELLKELQIATQQVLTTNNLGNTELSKSIEYTYANNQFVLLANDYFIFVSTGRRPRARKVPVEDLIQWMRRKGITPRLGSTYNQTAFAISESIYKNGIKAKNYINPIVDVTTEIITEDLANNLSEQIATEIAKDLTFKI